MINAREIRIFHISPGIELHSLLGYLINSQRESLLAVRQMGVLDEVNILQISVPIF